MAKKKTNNKTMKRRNFLKGAGAAALGAAAVSSFPAPAISGGHMEWIACSAFGKASGLGKAIDRFASYINNASDKLKVTVYHGGELVPPLESLDAVRSGAAQMAYGAGYYWTKHQYGTFVFCGFTFWSYSSRTKCMVLLWWRN